MQANIIAITDSQIARQTHITNDHIEHHTLANHQHGLKKRQSTTTS